MFFCRTTGETLYATLGIHKNASHDEIKKAFRGLALKLHPDKNRDDPDAIEKVRGLNIFFKCRA